MAIHPCKTGINFQHNMKQKNLLKTMLLLFALIVGSTSAWADTVTFTVGTDTSEGTSITKGGITIPFSEGVLNRTDNNMTIDFEDVIGNYTDWEFSNFGVSKSDITAHGGSYYGFKGDKATAYIKTKDKVTPASLTCYVSKTSNNTTESTWYIEVSENGSVWTEVKSTDATDMSKGVWKEFTADLSSYSDVYVRVYYKGSTAVRAIDDLMLVIQDPDEPSIVADDVINLTAEDTEGEIAYTIYNPVDGTTLTATSEADWISDITVGADKVTFTSSVNTGKTRNATITLTYGKATKDVTVTSTQDFTVNISNMCTDGSKYYRTFSAPYAFTVPEDVTVSEIGINDGKLNVQAYATGDVIPANTGVMISSATAGDKTFNLVAAAGTSVLGADNRLRASGISGIPAVTMEAADANCLYYRLTMHNGTTIGFWWGAENGAAFDLDGKKAYLAVPQEQAQNARGFSFDEELTGIAEMEAVKNVENAKFYNLAGQRIAQPTKGLYIVNGKKVIK